MKQIHAALFYLYLYRIYIPVVLIHLPITIKIYTYISLRVYTEHTAYISFTVNPQTPLRMYIQYLQETIYFTSSIDTP